MNEHGQAQTDAVVSQTGSRRKAKVSAATEVPEQEESRLERPVFVWFALPPEPRPVVPNLPTKAGDRRASPVPAKRCVDFDFLAKLPGVQQPDPREPEQSA